MATVYTLKMDESVYDDFTLIGIQTPLPDYRFAFFLNKQLDLRLAKCDELLSFPNDDSRGEYSSYKYEDIHNKWSLVSNIFEYKEPVGMFDEFVAEMYLLPEEKDKNFFLKVEGFVDEDELIELIDSIYKVSYAEIVAYTDYPSKGFLYF